MSEKRSTKTAPLPKRSENKFVFFKFTVVVLLLTACFTIIALFAIFKSDDIDVTFPLWSKSNSVHVLIHSQNSETEKNGIITNSQIFSAIPQANCSGGVFYYSLIENPNIFVPESPRSCKSFITSFVAPGGSLDATNRFLMDQNPGQIKVNLIGEGVQWLSSHYKDNVTIEITNIGTVSVDIMSIKLLAKNNQSKLLSGDVGFPISFDLRPKETIYVPLGSASDIARYVDINLNPESHFSITDSSNCPTGTTPGFINCRSLGFAIITSFVDIFDEQQSIPTIWFVKKIDYIDTRSFTISPEKK